MSLDVYKDTLLTERESKLPVKTFRFYYRFWGAQTTGRKLVWGSAEWEANDHLVCSEMPRDDVVYHA